MIGRYTAIPIFHKSMKAQARTCSMFCIFGTAIDAKLLADKQNFKLICPGYIQHIADLREDSWA